MVGNCFRKMRDTPRNPFEKERMVKELELVGRYGLRNKRELWTLQKVFTKDKERARNLLISSNPNDVLIDGRYLLNRLVKYGILGAIDLTDRDEVVSGLSKILDLTIDRYLDRRLQSCVFSAGLAKSIHQARVLVNSRCICVGDQIVDISSFMVKAEQEPFIEYNPYSRYGAKYKKSRGRKEVAVEAGE
jgi:small subunit ribosomal protein S9e